MQNKFFRFLFFFLIFLIVLQLFSNKDVNEVNKNDDILISSKSKFVIGKEVVVKIKNRRDKTITITNSCPNNPLLVEFYENGEWSGKNITLKNTSVCEQLKDLSIEPGKTETLGFGLWNQDLFEYTGKYKISYVITVNEKERKYSHEIDVVEPSFIRKGWNTLLYKPIFNTLFFLVDKLPGHSLGWAIIFLTLLIKIILLGPNQKALKSQKALQRVQPQLDALKQKYKNDPQRLSKETMAIWKKYKVSPMGSCLPMLIQFPILIALFYVVKGGLNITNPDMFYEPLKNFDLQMVNPIFLGLLDLTKVNVIILPIVIGGLQFFQIRLSFAKTKQSSNTPMPAMNKMMQFFLPVMIAVFTASVPAAVGFYWGTSTLFAIGQQIVVNRSKN